MRLSEPTTLLAYNAFSYPIAGLRRVTRREERAEVGGLVRKGEGVEDSGRYVEV